MSAKATIFLTSIRTPLGEMLSVAGDPGIFLLEFSDPGRWEKELEQVRDLFGAEITDGFHPWHEKLQQQLEEYFAGNRRDFELELQIKGTPFQEKIWKELLRIPYGSTRTYGHLAEVLNEPGSVRAVGHANGSNRLAIVVPCHRVIGADGSLTGYGGGLWRKRWLLRHEQKNCPGPWDLFPND